MILDSFLRSANPRITFLGQQPSWRPISTNEAFAIAPLVNGSGFASNDRWITAARKLADWTGNDRYRQLARVMFVSCGQMTDLATGVQGEQLLQTNYEQHDPRNTVEGMRGGYAERWNIYWITAHFLTAAADFQKLGVDWQSF